MSIKQILDATSRWMNGEGPASEVVVSTRVRLARNLQNHRFPQLLNRSEAREVIDEIRDLLAAMNNHLSDASYTLYELSELSKLYRQILVEKHLISPLLAKKEEGTAVVIRSDEAVSIMINEEDHLRSQCLLPGFQLEEALSLAVDVDELLDQRLAYAYDERYGYLTACPTNVGTGLRASIMMHLPGLVRSKRAANLFDTLSKVGIVIRGMYGEGSQALGHIFQLSNRMTLGQSEENIVENLKNVCQQMIREERSAREYVRRRGGAELEDRVWRAYGTLQHARRISSQEAVQLLSDVRLGIDLNLLSHLKPELFPRLLVLIRPGYVQYQAGEQLGPDERDQRRAHIIQQVMQEFAR